MLSEAKVTGIYCMSDDFCNEFALRQKKYMVEDKNRKRRNKLNRMNDAEIMSAIATYCFFEKKPAIDVSFINDGQLEIF